MVPVSSSVINHHLQTFHSCWFSHNLLISLIINKHILPTKLKNLQPTSILCLNSGLVQWYRIYKFRPHSLKVVRKKYNYTIALPTNFSHKQTEIFQTHNVHRTLYGERFDVRTDKWLQKRKAAHKMNRRNTRNPDDKLV